MDLRDENNILNYFDLTTSIDNDTLYFGCTFHNFSYHAIQRKITAFESYIWYRYIDLLISH